MAIENIFRYISLRPTKLEREKSRLHMYVYSKKDATAFYDSLAKASGAGAAKGELARIAAQFQKSPEYIADFRVDKYPVFDLLDWITDNGFLTWQDADFENASKTILGQKLSDTVASPEFAALYNNLRDSVLADILTDTAVVDKEEKVTSIKILYTIKKIADGSFIPEESETINDFFGRSTVVFPFIKSVNPRQEPEQPQEPRPSPDEEKKKENERKKKKLEELEKAHRELTAMALDDSFRKKDEERREEKREEGPAERPTERNPSETAARPIDPKLIIATPSSGLSSKVATNAREYILSEKGIKSLSAATLESLKTVRIEPDSINPIKAVGKIEEEMSFLSSTLEAEIPYTTMIPFGSGYIDKSKFGAAILSGARDIAGTIWGFLKKCSYKAGIGDLLIVRQKLKAYELAEFAHVENALAGETRERHHRRLNLREEIIVSETEKETEKERNLQSTERNEMQNEAEKVVQQQSHIDAGLQVSGSYGPSISFTASLNAGFSSSVEETQKKSTSYSREVTEKSSEKIRERVREERRRRTLEETEEINKHIINNSQPGADHVRGIYRWLNKIYDAQIFNYGKRMMYEFVLPEPGAYYLYATMENPPEDTELIKPEPPMFGSSPLKPANLGRTNYQTYVSLYNVTSAPEPPSQFVVKSYFDKHDGQDNVNLGRASAVAIPDGYEAFAANMAYNSVFEQGKETSARLMVGGLSIDRTYWGSEYRNFPRTFRGEISIVLSMMQKRSFALGVDVFCNLTPEGFSKWQHKMYDAIMQAYLDQKATYDAKMEQKKIQKGVEILGRNPIENRRTEKEELKKLIIMVLTNTNFLNINSYTSSAEPLMDLSKICKNGSYIRFFENAFEWHNILYVFYPYFWGRHAKWLNALHITDPDLDFAAFLKAGAARVQVPVRPGFEKAVAYFCQTGIIWDGNDVPLIGDDLYVPIIKEISESLGKLDDGVPYPEGALPWEVTVPTSLVVLQDLEEIPNIRDILTGNNIDIRNLLE